MPTLTLMPPLDITKSDREILMDAINYENRTNFIHTDFTFAAPVAAELAGSDINTKILLSPNIGSEYTNSQLFYYRRMDLAAIAANKPFEHTVTTETKLSQIIPVINTYYGINLRVDDYWEQDLPVYDPAQPGARLVVTLQAKADSILFNGVAQLGLNESAPAPDNDFYDRAYFFVVDSQDTTVYTNRLVSFNGNFQKVESFSPLRNAATVTKFNAQSVNILGNGNLFVRGDFEFTAAIGSASVTSFVVKNLLMTPNGTVIKADNTMFGPASVITWYGNSLDQKRYIVDLANSIGTYPAARLYRYDLDGVLDTSFNPAGISYVPTTVTTDRLGRVYTASPVYNDNGSKIRIDRLKVDGTLDADYLPVILSATGGTTPRAVYQLKTTKLHELFVLLSPAEGVSSIASVPVINSVSVVPGGTSQIYAYNPVFKFKPTGEWDRTYKSELLNNSPESVYEPNGSSLVYGDKVLGASQYGTNFLTNVRNPITGFLSRTVSNYDPKGEPIRISGAEYFSQVRWENAKHLSGLANGKSVVYGTAYLRLPSGGWSAATPVAAVYYDNSSLQSVFFKPERSNAGPALQIRALAVSEFEY